VRSPSTRAVETRSVPVTFKPGQVELQDELHSRQLVLPSPVVRRVAQPNSVLLGLRRLPPLGLHEGNEAALRAEHRSPDGAGAEHLLAAAVVLGLGLHENQFPDCRLAPTDCGRRREAGQGKESVNSLHHFGLLDRTASVVLQPSNSHGYRKDSPPGRPCKPRCRLI